MWKMRKMDVKIYTCWKLYVKNMHNVRKIPNYGVILCFAAVFEFRCDFWLRSVIVEFWCDFWVMVWFLWEVLVPKKKTKFVSKLQKPRFSILLVYKPVSSNRETKRYYKCPLYQQDRHKRKWAGKRSHRKHQCDVFNPIIYCKYPKLVGERFLTSA